MLEFDDDVDMVDAAWEVDGDIAPSMPTLERWQPARIQPHYHDYHEEEQKSASAAIVILSQEEDHKDEKMMKEEEATLSSEPLSDDVPPLDLLQFLEECPRCNRPLEKDLYIALCGHVFHERCCTNWRGCLLCENVWYPNHSSELDALFGGPSSSLAAASSAAAMVDDDLSILAAAPASASSRGKSNLLRDNLGNRRRSKKQQKHDEAAAKAAAAEAASLTNNKHKTLTRLFFDPAGILENMFATTTGAGEASDILASQISFSQEEHNVASLSVQQRIDLLVEKTTELSLAEMDLKKVEKEMIDYQSTIADKFKELNEWQDRLDCQTERKYRYKKQQKNLDSEKYKSKNETNALEDHVRQTIRGIVRNDKKDWEVREAAVEKDGVTTSISPTSSAAAATAPKTPAAPTSSAAPAPTTTSATTAASSSVGSTNTVAAFLASFTHWISLPQASASSIHSTHYLALPQNDFLRDMLLLDPNIIVAVMTKLQSTSGAGTGSEISFLRLPNQLDLLGEFGLGLDDLRSLWTRESFEILKKVAQEESYLAARVCKEQDLAAAAANASGGEEPKQSDPSTSIVLPPNPLLTALEPTDARLTQSHRTVTDLRKACHKLLHDTAEDPSEVMKLLQEQHRRANTFKKTIEHNQRRQQQLETQVQEMDAALERAKASLMQSEREKDQQQQQAQAQQEEPKRKKARLNEPAAAAVAVAPIAPINPATSRSTTPSSAGAMDISHSHSNIYTVDEDDSDEPMRQSFDAENGDDAHMIDPEPLHHAQHRRKQQQSNNRRETIDMDDVMAEEQQMMLDEHMTDAPSNSRSQSVHMLLDDGSSPVSSRKSSLPVSSIQPTSSRATFRLGSSVSTGKLRLAAAIDAVEMLDSATAAKPNINLANIGELAAKVVAAATQHVQPPVTKPNPFGLKATPPVVQGFSGVPLTSCSTAFDSLSAKLNPTNKAPRTLGGDLIVRGHDGRGGHVNVVRQVVPQPTMPKKRAPSPSAFSMDQLAFRPTREIASVNTKQQPRALSPSVSSSTRPAAASASPIATGGPSRSVSTGLSISATSSRPRVKVAPPAAAARTMRHPHTGQEIVDLAGDDDDTAETPATHPFFGKGFVNVTQSTLQMQQRANSTITKENNTQGKKTAQSQTRTPLAQLQTN